VTHAVSVCLFGLEMEKSCVVPLGGVPESVQPIAGATVPLSIKLRPWLVSPQEVGGTAKKDADMVMRAQLKTLVSQISTTQQFTFEVQREARSTEVAAPE
jgi:hypothetical protein